MKLAKTIIILLSLLIVTSIQAKTFKIATSAPDGSFWMKQMRAGAKKIKKETDGRVKFKFYPGGVMGSEDIVLKKMRIRQLQGAAISDSAITEFYPDSQIYSLPMIFSSFEEVDYVRNVMDKEIIKGLDKGGMVSFGLSEGGFAYTMSKGLIKRTEDLKKHKVWSPINHKPAEMTLKALGVNPVPLNLGDVLAGLQTNMIDTVAIPPIAAIALQWHTQIKYITDVPFIYLYATLIIDKKEFKKISKDDQIIVTNIMTKIFEKIDDQNRKDNIAAFSALVKQGIELISPNKNELTQWYKKGENARNSLKGEGVMSKKAYIKINKLLTEIRNKKELTGVTK